MSISASFIVKVNPRVITGGSDNLEFNGLFLADENTISADTLVLTFTSVAQVGAYFGLDSEIYAQSQRYFEGYLNRFSSPRAMLVARRISAPVHGWLRGASLNSNLAQLKTITDGSMIITIDSEVITISDIDLSGATSLSNAGEIIQAALEAESTGVTVTYSSVFNAFTVTSGTNGPESHVAYAEAGPSGTDLAAVLGLDEASNGTLSSGSYGLSAQEQMAEVVARSENWVSFTTIDEIGAEEALEFAAWASVNYGYLYVPHTTNTNAISQDSSDDLASLIRAGNLAHTWPIYGTVDYASFAMGAIACISWQRTNGTITLAFKRQAGLAAYVVKESDAAILESKGFSYVGDFATRNAQFVFLYNSELPGDAFRWVDSYINSVWLSNRLQVSVMDGLSASGRTPYNERGYTMIRAWMNDPIQEGLNNAAIEPGIALSEGQKSQLTNEAGTADILDALDSQGYFIQIIDPGASVRAQRETPIVNLWYTYGGAIQRIEIASTAVL